MFKKCIICSRDYSTLYDFKDIADDKDILKMLDTRTDSLCRRCSITLIKRLNRITKDFFE